MKGPFFQYICKRTKDMSCCTFGSAGVRREPGNNQDNEVGNLAREKRRNRRQLPVEEMPKDKMASKVAKVIGVPEDAFTAQPQIELSGNREAVVEGCQGILEYDECVIRLNLGKMMLRFCGRNLQLRCMAAQSVVVEGYIMSMEFLT